MKKYAHIYTLFLVFVLYTSCKGQNKTNVLNSDIKPGNKYVHTSFGPKRIVRSIIQDRKGNIWIAAFDGVFRYDSKSFTNITAQVSSARFFSVSADRKGNLWFGSIGSGVYYYNGKSFRNYTTRDGLVKNRVTDIFEDKTGNIWFATEGGVSCFNGKSFRNFTTKEGLPNNDTNCIMEDKTGKFWFGTKGNACIYNGKKFTVLTHDGKPFTNVRTIIRDKKDNIWFGGNDGLWRFDGKRFINITQNFVGYIYQDKQGNIWTGSQESSGNTWNKMGNILAGSEENHRGSWVLSRYDEKSLYNKKPTVTEIKSEEGMITGILKANDGSIWFGTTDGVYHYDGNATRGFRDRKGQK